MPEIAWSVALVVLTAALSALIVRASIGYAHQRGMLDVPGQRRSHSLPTPRGGGLGIVLATALAAGFFLSRGPGAPGAMLIIAFETALLLVAGIGWWDDHHALPVLPRLGVQALAVLLFSVVLTAVGAPSLAWLPLLLVAGVGSINLHNFMDGIDGLLGMQTVFMGLALAWLSWSGHEAALGWTCAALAAAAAGFLLFNRPPARIFMGDVGSGTIGLLLFMLIALAWSTDMSRVWGMLILASGFAIDSGMTLSWRILRGRRWYAAHREHAYQWLVRRGWTHGRTGSLYMLWNLTTLPFAWLARAERPFAPLVCVGVYALGIVAWCGVRKSLLKQARAGSAA